MSMYITFSGMFYAVPDLPKVKAVLDTLKNQNPSLEMCCAETGNAISIDMYWEGYSSSDYPETLLEALSDLLIDGLAEVSSEDQNYRYTWNPKTRCFDEAVGMTCFSLEEAESFWPREVSYDDLLNFFVSYVENVANAADLSYVRDAIAAAGVDEKAAKALGFNWLYEEE